MGTFQPMLAKHAADSDFRFPLYLSPKLDGWRCTTHPEGLRTRTMKPFRNKATNEFFHRPELFGMDGELIVGPPNGDRVIKLTTSGVSTERFDPKANLYVFDLFDNPNIAYKSRLALLEKRVAALPDDLRARVVLLPQIECYTLEDLLRYEQTILEQGYEGLIARSPHAPYKFGRSTLSEHYLLKVKRFVDAEAEVVGIVEMLINRNTAYRNELGRTKRSTAAAGMEPGGTAGALLCRYRDTLFTIGSGLDTADCAAWWARRAGDPQVAIVERINDDGQITRDRVPYYVPDRPALIKFKHFVYGSDGKVPRHPVYLVERMLEDHSRV